MFKAKAKAKAKAKYPFISFVNYGYESLGIGIIEQ